MNVPRSLAGCALPVVVLGLAACGSDPDLGVRGAAVFADDGDPLAVPDNGAHPQIVGVRQSFTGLCTGTIVASNRVLTAAHCVNQPNNPADIEVRVDLNTSAQVQSDLLAQPGISLNAQNQLVWDVVDRDIHPLFNSVDPLDSDVDVAVLTMASPIPPALIEPLPVLPDILPAPFIGGQEGYDRWVAYYADFIGAGNTDSGCMFGAHTEVIRFEIEVLDAELGPSAAVQLRWKDSSGFGASRTCGGDSGGPFVTAVADFIGANNIDPGFVMSVLSGGTTGQAIGPLLVGGNRTFVAQQALDADGDGIEAAFDTCDHVFNPDQGTTDSDGDGWPNVNCDDDDDNDGVDDIFDNCDTIANPGQANQDGDASGDACDWDDDGDFVADGDDNCPMVSNPHQQNCNADAEQRGFAGADPGIVLGDACDPVPCAPADTDASEFVAHKTVLRFTGEAICADSYGRLYEDIIDISGRVKAGNPAVATTKLEAWFCGCEADTLAECGQPPWSCGLSPTAGTAPGSRWRKLSLTTLADPAVAVAQPLAATFSPWQALPPGTLYRWDYVTDYNTWIGSQGLWSPTPNDPGVYGAGTDMVGVLWVEDPSSLGLSAHGAGGCSGAGCSLASSYLVEAAPDRALKISHCNKIPELAPAPWWTYCARCDDRIRLPWEDVINPGYVSVLDEQVRVFSSKVARPRGVAPGGGADVTALFAPALISALASTASRVVGPSEPAGVALQPGRARAIALAGDGSRLLGEVVAGARQFELRALASSTGVPARTGFATAYSLGDGALRLAGGVDRSGRVLGEYWRWTRTGGWRRTPIDTRVAPTAAVSSVFGGDRALWVIDRAGDRLAIHRIVEATGAGRVGSLAALDRARNAWLFGLADGDVALATTTADGYQLARLTWTTGAPRTTPIAEGRGELAGAPYATAGGIAVPVHAGTREAAGVAVHLVPAGELAAR